MIMMIIWCRRLHIKQLCAALCNLKFNYVQMVMEQVDLIAAEWTPRY